MSELRRGYRVVSTHSECNSARNRQPKKDSDMISTLRITMHPRWALLDTGLIHSFSSRTPDMVARRPIELFISSDLAHRLGHCRR